MNAMRFDAATPSTLFVVFADPEEHENAEFQRWYDEVHGPDALGNGSFVALNRFEAVGAGHIAAPYLAFWEGRFANETDAWAYIRPRAMELRAAGRAGDIASVTFAIMLVQARVFAHSSALQPVRSLTTVQSDWRYADTNLSAEEWWKAANLDQAPAADTTWLVTSDPDVRGPGMHLAAFASSASPHETMQAWQGFGAAGMSPVPPYTNIFGIEAGPNENEPDRALAWVMHWSPIASQRVSDADLSGDARP